MPSTASSPSTRSSILPDRPARTPPLRVASIPPTVALSIPHGKCPKLAPAAASTSSSLRAFTPASTSTTRASRSMRGAPTSRFRSSAMPPRSGMAAPVPALPPPTGVSGTRSATA